MIISGKIIRKKLKHYNEPGHAHELTFSFYRRKLYGNDSVLCEIFLDELDRSRQSDCFLLWAYVIMPSHVHMLILPQLKQYDIAGILQNIKGKASRRFREFIISNKPEMFHIFCILTGGHKTFRIWQAGAGFDRNLWNSKAIHKSIEYIEGNPVRSGLVQSPEEWKWSSAHARFRNVRVVPDSAEIPVYMK